MRLDPETIEATAKALRDETDEHRERMRTPARVNRYIASLSRVLGYATRTLRWITVNPCQSVRRFKEPPGRTRFLTEDEADTLRAAVDAAPQTRVLAVRAHGAWNWRAARRTGEAALERHRLHVQPHYIPRYEDW